MITRSKLVEQLFKDHQVHSQRRCPALTIFSPKPFLTSWVDVAVAILYAVLFGVLVVLSYLTLHFRYSGLSFLIICLVILLAVRLRMSRWEFARKKEKRMLLPLSI
ncbi:hypothetical protein Ancab_026144 [Ancistrocladus abbreviatus]